MKKQVFRLSALLLCLILVFTLGACKGKTEEESSNFDAANSADPENILPSDESTPPASEMGSQGEESTDTNPSETAGQNGTTAAQKDNGKPTEPTIKAQQDSQPKTTAEIVAYYNKAANKLKTDKPGYTKKYTMRQFPGSQATLGKATVPSWLVKLISKNETTTVNKGSSSNDTYPAAGFSWASKLTAQYVQSATCKKSGSTYQIKIVLKDETNPQRG